MTERMTPPPCWAAGSRAGMGKIHKLIGGDFQLTHNDIPRRERQRTEPIWPIDIGAGHHGDGRAIQFMNSAAV